MASFTHAQFVTVSNEQMTVEYGYEPISSHMKSSPSYIVSILLKKPSQLNQRTTLKAPEILIPVGVKVNLMLNGGASAREESYGFFTFSRKDCSEDEILSPNDSTIHSFSERLFAPNINRIIDGDSYYEQSRLLVDFSKVPLIGSWFYNLKDNQLKEVPCLEFWSANKEGSFQLKFIGSIGCDQREPLEQYSGWKWHPKRTRNGDVISVSIEVPVTITSDQDYSENDIKFLE